MTPWPSTSLRLRLLGLTAVGLALALLLAWFVLGGLFRDESMRQFRHGLEQQLDQLTARVEFDAQGQPTVDAASLSDPRWHKPYSGLYWQLNDADQGALLRSRSLWDTRLANAPDALGDATVHAHAGTGPQDAPLLVLERVVRSPDQPGTRWRLLVAADSRAVQDAVAQFRSVLAWSLAALLALLLAAAWAQVALGLAPLRALQRALAELQAGRSQRLQGPAPLEVQPLVDGFNTVLDSHAQLVQRARQQAGDLAHAVKTPLAVLSQAAEAALARQQRDPSQAGDTRLATLVLEQVAQARREVDWHLARARAAGGRGVPGQRVALAPVVRDLLRVMDKVHAARALALRCADIDVDLAFAGEAQDLQEILGNLLDNACKWARAAVSVAAQLASGAGPPVLVITVQDDGPGIAAQQRDAVLARGVRVDESVPGSGLGLAIVADRVAAYGGTLALESAPHGGLRVVVRLPAAV
ncbi:sensor histidine kinase [Comamonadaceae bacterium G21597-S1]|nr:sensor histidine kinase [Comamonadaceae bacterium G21597-S1]